MSQERFWVLLSKKIAREASDAEVMELQDLIHQNPDWQYAVQSIEDLWDIRIEPDELQAENAFYSHVQRMKEKRIGYGPEEEVILVPRKRFMKFRWYYAAAALLIMAMGFYAFRNLASAHESRTLAREVNEISTRPGSKTRIELPDGSVVWLNAGSRLTYNKDFNKARREVSLTGEGYFDVAKNKEKPFIIHTSNINIKVLGTVFNVKAYPQDKRTETSLIRGSVEVTILNRPDDKIILSPSEKLIVDNNASVVPKLSGREEKAVEPHTELIAVNRITYDPKDNTVAETEWINNRLVFRDESFEELAVQMERWYNVSIEIRDEDLKTKRLSGTFENETPTQALEALKYSIPFKYTQDGNKIFIYR